LKQKSKPTATAHQRTFAQKNTAHLKPHYLLVAKRFAVRAKPYLIDNWSISLNKVAKKTLSKKYMTVLC
jgi:hypothetical protein